MDLSEENRVMCDKRIAYFLGWRIDNSFPDKNRVWRLGNNVELDSTFKFSNDYEALMNVVEKIEDLGFIFMINKACVRVYRTQEEKVFGNLIEIDSPSIKDKRTAIYLAVAEFCRINLELK